MIHDVEQGNGGGEEGGMAPLPLSGKIEHGQGGETPSE